MLKGGMAAVDEWLTRQEVSKRLKIPKATLDQWAHLGQGPRFAKFGRHCRYRLADVIAWEEAQFGGDAA
jgi:excisionase family DNA binding protein